MQTSQTSFLQSNDLNDRLESITSVSQGENVIMIPPCLRPQPGSLCDVGYSFATAEELTGEDIDKIIPENRRYAIQIGNKTVCMDALELSRWLNISRTNSIRSPFGECQLSEKQKEEIAELVQQLSPVEEQELTVGAEWWQESQTVADLLESLLATTPRPPSEQEINLADHILHLMQSNDPQAVFDSLKQSDPVMVNYLAPFLFFTAIDLGKYFILSQFVYIDLQGAMTLDQTIQILERTIMSANSSVILLVTGGFNLRPRETEIIVGDEIDRIRRLYRDATLRTDGSACALVSTLFLKSQILPTIEEVKWAITNRNIELVFLFTRLATLKAEPSEIMELLNISIEIESVGLARIVAAAAIANNVTLDEDLLYILINNVRRNNTEEARKIESIITDLIRAQPAPQSFRMIERTAPSSTRRRLFSPTTTSTPQPASILAPERESSSL